MGRGKGKGKGKGKKGRPLRKFDPYGVGKMRNRGKSGAKGTKGKTEAEKMKGRTTTARTHTTGGKAPSSGRMAGRSRPGDVNADAAKANWRDFQQGRFPGL